MIEVVSVLLLLLILHLIAAAFSLNSGSGWSRPGSNADPFAKHIHIITSQEDIDRLPCDVPGCPMSGASR